jgi:hypothetical protein
MKGEVLFHLINPSDGVRTIKFMYVNFGNLIPRGWRTPRGVEQVGILIMGRLTVLRIGLKILTLEEFLQSVGLLVKYSL